MAKPVKKRKYDASGRREAAEQTRLRVLRAARDLFADRGYAGTSVSDIARSAGVSIDTLYTTIGRKPQLLLAVHDMELAGGGSPVAATERDYVAQMQAASTAVEKIGIYAGALAERLPRTAPLLASLRAAGETDPECRQVYETVSERRRANMRLLATDLRSTGDLRDDLDEDTIADIVWSMNSPDYYLLIRSAGRTAEQYGSIVRDIWLRTFLRAPPAAPA